MSTAWRIFVPGDASALSVGAEAVAQAVLAAARERGLPVELIRNGSRGLFWLEPLLEVATRHGRLDFGPVGAADVAALLEAGLLDPAREHAAGHPLALGPVEEHHPVSSHADFLAAAHASIVRMANQIAVAFAAEADPMAATAEHTAAFWDPHMRSQLRVAAADDQSGLHPVALAAARRLDGVP